MWRTSAASPPAPRRPRSAGSSPPRRVDREAVNRRVVHAGLDPARRRAPARNASRSIPVVSTTVNRWCAEPRARLRRRRGPARRRPRSRRGSARRGPAARSFSASRRPRRRRGQRRPRLVDAVVEAELDDVVARRVPAVAIPGQASSCRASAAAASARPTSSSSVTTMPPSPTARFLFEKKLNAPAAPERAQVPPADPRPGGVRGVLQQHQARARRTARRAPALRRDGRRRPSS